MNLRTYLNSLPLPEQRAFATRCGTTVNYLRKAITRRQRHDVTLCIAIERESGCAVRCEDLRPDVDWHYLRCVRGEPSRPRSKRAECCAH